MSKPSISQTTSSQHHWLQSQHHWLQSQHHWLHSQHHWVQHHWSRWRATIWRASPFPAGVLAALTGLFLYNFFFPAPTPLTAHELNDTVAQAMASVTPPPSFSSRVYRSIQPSLVLIHTEGPGEDGELNNGIGSGVVIDDFGDILTSLHVVDNASTIRLIFADGTEADAEIISTQPENDIAVLQPDTLPQVLVPAVLGNPHAMRIGDEAFVVGHPLGLYGSMSAGVISGFDRSFTPMDSEQKLHGLIQIDAAVNRGNSGGPLLNREGHVVGIIAALVNPTEQDVFIGIGFAVPINVAVAGIGSPPY
jgi:S1-C subfamily serine protease